MKRSRPRSRRRVIDGTCPFRIEHRRIPVDQPLVAVEVVAEERRRGQARAERRCADASIFTRSIRVDRRRIASRARVCLRLGTEGKEPPTGGERGHRERK
jgi:hypothetical protein